MRSVLTVLFDELQSLDVTGPLEVFTGANTWLTYHGDGPACDIRTASLGGRTVRTSSGLRITPDGDLREFGVSPPDLLIVPGGEGARRADPELVAWLRANGRRANRLVSVCTGAFLLAEAGLLDGLVRGFGRRLSREPLRPRRTRPRGGRSRTGRSPARRRRPAPRGSSRPAGRRTR
jgi:transcriptional regulator GlxA family with amidase domain